VNISTAELRTVAGRLFDHLDAIGVTHVELPNDYYWEVTPDQRYDPTRDPEDFTLEQIAHDLERLREVASGREEPVAHALHWLSAILREVAQQTRG
jgi:hypothetical protein